MHYQDCAEVRKRLSIYLEGYCTGVEAREICDHLASCRDCKLALEQEQNFLLFLHENLQSPPAPPDVRAKVQVLLRGCRINNRGYWLWLIPSVFAGTILVVFLLIHQQICRFDWAVDEHLALKDKEHLLAMHSDNPLVLKEWVGRQAGHPIQFVSALSPKIHIQGGRLVPGKNIQIVQIAFSGGQELSSLYAVPREFIRTQGEAVAMNSLVFYVQKKKEHFVVAWKGAGAGYVLVSNSEQGINGGCLLCHAGETIQLPSTAFLVES